MPRSLFSKTILGIVVVVVVIAAVAVAVRAFMPQAQNTDSSLASIGIGNLRRLEAQQSGSSAGVTASDRPSVGMGDLRRVEAQLTNTTCVSTPSSGLQVGIGDLRRFEALQAVKDSNPGVTQSAC
jgi:hypothetical protein